MVEFEKLKRTEIEFGEDEFIEVARKKSVSGEGEDEFVSVARGFISDEGSRRYRSNISLPADEEVIEFIAEKLPEMQAE